MKQSNRHRICAKMRAGKERKRLESSTPDYPIELPELRRKIIIIDYDFGKKINVLSLYKSNRIDCFDVHVNGMLWKKRIGFSRILQGIRKALPRVNARY
jgi:hypothetical protein